MFEKPLWRKYVIKKYFVIFGIITQHYRRRNDGNTAVYLKLFFVSSYLFCSILHIVVLYIVKFLKNVMNYLMRFLKIQSEIEV